MLGLHEKTYFCVYIIYDYFFRIARKESQTEDGIVIGQLDD
jgi:hypothetical protein